MIAARTILKVIWAMLRSPTGCRLVFTRTEQVDVTLQPKFIVRLQYPHSGCRVVMWYNWRWVVWNPRIFTRDLGH